jgi:hypothetical protein
MVLRKIKSAPANLCEMSNNKKSKSITFQKQFLLFNKEMSEEDYHNENNKNLYVNDKKFILKEKKKSIEMASNIINEILLENKNPQSEEYFIINFLIPYLGNNIITKNFLKNIFDSLISYLVKSFIVYLFHMLQNHNIDQIEYFLHLDNFIDKILNKERSI